MMLFPAVLMNFTNLKVCLIGEWSIMDWHAIEVLEEQTCGVSREPKFKPKLSIPTLRRTPLVKLTALSP